MTTDYEKFKELKEKQSDANKEARAGTTMVYYERIGEMLSSGMYAHQETFLYSVQQFIEEHEYISDKQMEVIDRIYNNSNESLPF